MENDSLFFLIVNSTLDNGELPGDFNLPQKEDAKVNFADGALDGISIYHMGQAPLTEEENNRLAMLINTAAEGKYEEAQEGFRAFCESKRAVGIIDDIQKYILAHTEQLDAGNMYRFAVNMMMKSNHTECVKIGMIILELFNTEDNITLADAVRAIGVCNEFTLFSVFLMRNWDNGAMEVLELAKRVHGWGRIHCMEFIEPENDEIKAWILENGVDNEVMPAYSGLNAFEKADVTGVLAGETITAKEMKGILKIVSALLDEGPVSGISNLDDPNSFLENVLKKANAMLPLDDEACKIIEEIETWQKENRD